MKALELPDPPHRFSTSPAIRRLPWLSLIAWAVASAGFSADPERPEGSNLGRVEFENSGHSGAQSDFLRGVAALHNFWYDEAEARFRRAQEADPDFAMAYWGEAMCHNAPIWSEQDAEKAQSVLSRLAATPRQRLAKAKLPHEKGLLAALEILFGEGDKPSRDRAYSEAMGRLYREFEYDPEIATFYALSLQGMNRSGTRDPKVKMWSAAIAQRTLTTYPRHPGAAHYLIHAVDDPVHAPLGLEAARSYAKIAPASNHALHMPSHIFLVLGLWDDAARSDEAASAAAEAMVERGELTLADRHFHSVHWLSYIYPQLGRFTAARARAAELEAAARNTGEAQTRGMAGLIEAMVAVQTGDWQRVEMPDPTGEVGFFGGVEAAQLLVAGLSAANSVDLAGAAMARTRLDEISLRFRDNGDLRRATSAEIMALEVGALALHRRGDGDRALELAKRAADIEAARELPIIPRSIKPALELFGEILLDLGKPNQAAEQFLRALNRSPNRSLSVLGVARANRRAGERESACLHFAQFLENWHGADPTLPELEEARAAVRVLECDRPE